MRAVKAIYDRAVNEAVALREAAGLDVRLGDPLSRRVR
jgi:hypothetical protein